MMEMDAISEEVNKHPEITSMKVPENLYRELKRDIAEYEAEKKAAEEKMHQEELIRLGLIYQRKRKFRKYYVLAAAVIMVFAFGITSLGGPERIFNSVKTIIAGREQEVVDSEDISVVTNMKEDEVLEQIEAQLGMYPIKLNYLPSGVEFLEVNSFSELQEIIMYYGYGDAANIIYTIRANYRDSSWAKDIEDELIEEYEIETNQTIIKIREYAVEGESNRMIALYEYKDVQYSLLLLDMEQNEAEKIINNLIFK